VSDQLCKQFTDRDKQLCVKRSRNNEVSKQPLVLVTTLMSKTHTVSRSLQLFTSKLYRIRDRSTF